MIFGFNTDVPAKEGIYHVQTEDRGRKRAVIESIIYVGGKIMGRKRTPYDRDEVSQERIEEMVRRQHKDLVESIRAGTWVPSKEGPKETIAPAAPKGYAIQLKNSDKVRHGEFLRFQLTVEDRAQKEPAASVLLDVRWVLGGNVVEKQTLHSQADGGAELWLPRPSDQMYGSLLIRAEGPAGREIVKFHVRGSTED
jgi:hypothetical protein